jgi:thymidylate kinase
MIDLVIGGPDMSGTSTQIIFVVDYLKSLGKKIRDIRGTEIDVLFHAEIFNEYNENYISLKDFLLDENVSEDRKKEFIYKANDLLLGLSEKPDLKIASMLENDITTYINPDKADVWVMEEPVRRGAGQTNRTLEQNRSKFNSQMDPVSATFCHQVYRIDEFYRFRKILREKDKIIIRSRSEESACYQIHDANSLKLGVSKNLYIQLPGNKIAFSFPPTHIFIVCGPENWTKDQFLLTTDDTKLVFEKYRDFRNKRSESRSNLDDHELNIDYQLLVNKRYAGKWIDNLYLDACKKYNSKMPEITKFKIFDTKEGIKEKMIAKMKDILRI